MKNASYLPRDKAGRELWLKNFVAKLTKYAAKYNILPAEITEIIQALAYVVYINDYVNQYEDYLKELIAYQKEVHDGNSNNNTPSIAPAPPVFTNVPPAVAPAVFVRAISMANRIREHHKYTVADGNDLGIEVAPKAKKVIDIDNAKPVITIQLVDGGHPELVWKRNGLDALEILVDRNGGDDFKFCEVDLKPNYTDTHELPEKPALWRYKAIYRKDNKQVGQWSDIMSIAVVKL
ncbi:MAG: hypothetical protein U0U67_10905 [Chitinophagales bacterium]